MIIRHNNILFSLLLICALCISGCVTKKKKGDIGWIKKAYHNTTAKYNGYYNANVIMDETFAALEDQHQDNYNKLLDVYPYIAVDNPKSMAGELDRAIEKVTIVALNHEPSHWVDDCYVLMGKAQFLKQDYETAEETFQYFEEEFNPANPSSRVYNKSNSNNDKRDQRKDEELQRKKEAREAKKLREKERKEKEEREDEEREAKAKIEEQERKAKERERKEALDERKAADERSKKEREAERQESERQKKEERESKEKFRSDEKKLKDKVSSLKKDLAQAEADRREQERKQKEERRKNKKRDKKIDPKADPRSAKEISLEAQIKAKESELSSLQDNYEKTTQSRIAENKRKAEQREKDRIARNAATEAAKQKKAEDKVKAAEAKKQREIEEAKRKEEALLKEAELEAKAEEENEIQEIESSKTETIKRSTKTEDGGLFKHKTVYSEGLLWLAKTYIERQNYGSADYILKKLGATIPVTDAVKKQVPAARAHLNIKKENYTGAIPDLEEAIEYADNNSDKARYQYIIAQIYQMSGNVASAKEAFEDVKRFKPPYDMEFNSQLSVARNAWKTGRGSVDGVISDLDKMARQEKNQEYLDQIYFTKGEIKLASGDQKGALEDFKEAASFNSGNTQQQAESFYNLASLFYDTDEFVKAQSYYDSTAQVLNNKDERYAQVTERANKLKPIARNLKSLIRNDSLMQLASLSEDDLKEWAEQELDKQREAQEQEDQLNEAPAVTNNTKPNFNKAGKKSNFFAYNPITLDKGQRDFDRRWGSRTLEDNWRRSSKSSSVFDNDNQEEIVEQESEDDEADIADILRDVPRTQAQQKATNSKIEKSLYDLGKQFRSEIQNYGQSINHLKRLINEYPDTEHKLDAYYFLYLDYLDLDDSASAKRYADLIVSEFPDSEFAKSISDPNYAKQKAKQENNKEQYYQTTYSIFENRDYTKVLERVEESKTLFGAKNDYTAKMDLLKAMSIGGIDGKDEYVKALNDVINKHPNTDEEVRAKEIVRFLKGDLNAFDNRIYDEKVEEFTVEDDKLHYVIVTMFDSQDKNVNNAKLAISSYNKKYHKSDGLKITDIYLNPESKSKIILIRRFKNKADAMDYLDGAEKNAKDFIDKNETAFDIHAVTQRNYREIIKQTSIKNYQIFYDSNYK